MFLVLYEESIGYKVSPKNMKIRFLNVRIISAICGRKKALFWDNVLNDKWLRDYTYFELRTAMNLFMNIMFVEVP